MQDLAQQLLIFGTHVHIGIEDREFLIDAMNVVALLRCRTCSACPRSSPFWMGRNTGLKSYRSDHLPQLPAHRHPAASCSRLGRLRRPASRRWSRRSASRTARRSGGTCGRTTRYPTLEFRICDVCTRVDEAVCIAAIFQAIIAKLWKLRRDNLTFRVYPTDLIEENKWRAVRYGLDGKLIDFGKQQEVPARELIRELIEWFLDDVIDELGSRKEVEYAFRILEDGSSADRQLATFERTGDLKAVVDQLIAETAEGVRPVPAPGRRTSGARVARDDAPDGSGEPGRGVTARVICHRGPPPATGACRRRPHRPASYNAVTRTDIPWTHAAPPARIVGVPTQTLQSFGGIPADMPPSWVMSQRYIQTLAAAGALPCDAAAARGRRDDAARDVRRGSTASSFPAAPTSTRRATAPSAIPKCDTATDRRRDALELAMVRWAIEDGKPVLGVCRGLQIINVAAGGTL